MAPVVQVWGDVFTFPTALAHAVSADLHMGAGVAVDFRQHFGCVEELLSQNRRVGEVAYLEHNNYYIFYLITKQHYWEKDVAVKVNIVTPLPKVHGMAVAGDSQALRLLVARCKLPSGFNQSSRQVGLCGSGWTATRLIEALNELPDNALDNVLVLIGTNDILHMCQSSEPKEMKKRLRHICTVLRTTLSAKCKACCRAVVTTVPPIPKILAPRDRDMDKAEKAHFLWAQFNKRLLSLSTSRFHVLDLDDLFFQTIGDQQIIREDMFERFMGIGNFKREDRIHINNKGRRVLLEALSSIPPLTL